MGRAGGDVSIARTGRRRAHGVRGHCDGGGAMSDAPSAGQDDTHPVGELYGRWTLNFLVDLAHTIAHDFVARPRQYRDVPEDIAALLSDFRFKMGAAPEWPDAFQRTLSFKMLHRVWHRVSRPDDGPVGDWVGAAARSRARAGPVRPGARAAETGLAGVERQEMSVAACARHARPSLDGGGGSPVHGEHCWRDDAA